MKTTIIRIVTRKSPLALWQANYVKHALEKAHPHLQVEVMGILTMADRLWAMPLTRIGGKGLFVKELEQAILEHRADIAVHSLKDMPVEFPGGLILGAICKREDPRDVLIAKQVSQLQDLPDNAILGTSSLRRQAQLAALRPDLNIVPLRGNVGTRLEKLQRGEMSAIVLAAAGIQRLGLANEISSYFATDVIIPAIGQGAVGIECREDDDVARELIARLDDAATRYCVTAERAVNARLGGNCKVPIAAYAQLADGEIHLQAMVGKPNGSQILKTYRSDIIANATTLGIQVAEALLAQGAADILREFTEQNDNAE
ncbi:MAG: hydroxymethylbilane synthase [Coxiellaceae bacterium]|nr:MAG: hydroxymethylbilane synthase [Coxiellaceae bacterium]